MERINWAQGKARWQALVNAEMNLWVVKSGGVHCLAEVVQLLKK